MKSLYRSFVQNIVIVTAIVFIGCLNSRCEASSDLIIPGLSIGSIRLGMTKMEVHNLPNYGVWRRDNIKPGLYVEYTNGSKETYSVVYKNDQAIQIATRDKRTHLKNGLSRKSNLEQWSKVFPLSVKRWNVELNNVPEDADNNGYCWSIYDSMKSGIAITTESLDYISSEDLPNQIIVHPRKSRTIRYVIDGRIDGRSTSQPELFMVIKKDPRNDLSLMTVKLSPGQHILIGEHTGEVIGASTEDAMMILRPAWMKHDNALWEKTLKKTNVFVEFINEPAEAEFVSYGKENIVAVRMLTKVHVGEVIYIYRETCAPMPK